MKITTNPPEIIPHDAEGHLVRLENETDEEYLARTAQVLHQTGMSANDPADVIGSDDAENGGEEALAPTITSLDPSTSIVGALNFILTIDGTGFSEESLLFINGSEVPCTLMSDTQLTTEVASSTITVPGMYTLEVHNGALVSNPMTFEFTAAGTREGSSRKHK